MNDPSDPADRDGGPPQGGADSARDLARRLMRQGLDDEAIEARTGLGALEILELRAAASVGNGSPGTRSPRGRSPR